MLLDRLALILTIVGALNWGSIGLFQFDIVAWICGGQDAVVSRIIYTLVAIAGVWCISLLFHEDGTPTPRTDKILRATPMGRFGKPEELLGTLNWLCDENASGFVTGVVVPVDGGFSAYSGV